MESVAILLAIAFAVNKTVSVLKAAANRDVNAVVTQLAVWIIGTLAIILCSHASLTENLVVPGLAIPLGVLDWPSQILLGWVAGSTGSFAFDIKKAIDASDTSIEKPLITSGQHAS